MEEFEDNKNKINIRDIKSSFNIEEIFSFLPKKQTLNIIIYNKELQKIFSIDIRYYKKISGKYIVYEKNGKGREYLANKNILIYEGEQKKGKRNGKGKEYYDDGKPMLEGDYKNGKRWNIKGYNKNGTIEFELNNGNGKGKLK